jgi:hypothetical protein
LLSCADAEQAKRMMRVAQARNPLSAVSSRESIELTVAEVERFQETRFASDNILNDCAKLLMAYDKAMNDGNPTILCMNTFFAQNLELRDHGPEKMTRWVTKALGPTSLKGINVILIPCHVGALGTVYVHWALVVIELTGPKVGVYVMDSCGKPSMDLWAPRFVPLIKKYFRAEYKRMAKRMRFTHITTPYFLFDTCAHIHRDQGFPQQTKGSNDCGFFVIRNMSLYISADPVNGPNFNFEPSSMNSDFRLRVLLDLVRGIPHFSLYLVGASSSPAKRARYYLDHSPTKAATAKAKGRGPPKPCETKSNRKLFLGLDPGVSATTGDGDCLWHGAFGTLQPTTDEYTTNNHGLMRDDFMKFLAHFRAVFDMHVSLRPGAITMLDFFYKSENLRRRYTIDPHLYAQLLEAHRASALQMTQMKEARTVLIDLCIKMAFDEACTLSERHTLVLVIVRNVVLAHHSSSESIKISNELKTQWRRQHLESTIESYVRQSDDLHDIWDIFRNLATCAAAARRVLDINMQTVMDVLSTLPFDLHRNALQTYARCLQSMETTPSNEVYNTPLAWTEFLRIATAQRQCYYPPREALQFIVEISQAPITCSAKHGTSSLYVCMYLAVSVCLHVSITCLYICG